MPTPQQNKEIIESIEAFRHTYSLLESSGVGYDVLCYAILNVALTKIIETHGAKTGLKAALDILRQHAESHAGRNSRG